MPPLVPGRGALPPETRGSRFGGTRPGHVRGYDQVVTLILSVVTPDYVIQACDRRLTYIHPKVAVKTDAALKGVLFNYHTVFSYTGLAELPRSARVVAARGAGPRLQPTNTWLAEVLALGDDLGGALSSLLTEATSSVSRVRAPTWARRQAFVGVGWSRPADDAPLEATLYEVSNFVDVRSFALNVLTLGPAPYGSHTSKPLPDKILRRHDRLLAALNLRNLGPAPVGRILIDTLRAVARVDQTVGKGALLMCLPRTQVERVLAGADWAIGAGEPQLEHMSFLHYPADTDDGLFHGPTVVLGDKTVIGQLSLGSETRPIRVQGSPPEQGQPEAPSESPDAPAGSEPEDERDA